VSKDIIVLVHTLLVPDESIKEKDLDRFKTPWLTEYDVVTQLKKLKHTIRIVSIHDDLAPLLNEIKTKKPDIVFNLLEQFNNDSKMEYNLVALLELLGVSYTGCNSKGLLMAKDKALSKKILKHHHIGTANFYTLPKNKKKKIPKTVKFPLIVKCLFEEASLGISQASIVNNIDKLTERIKFIHESLDQDAIIEEFIEGREMFVGIIGNKQLKTLPIWELSFKNADSPEKEIYSQRAKWNEKYRKRKGIMTKEAKLDSTLENKIIMACKKVYQVLNLSGYARIDMRVTNEGKIYILEANPNPNIASDDEFAKSAQHIGIKYSELLEILIK
jgi:D-alanine-D-alanine ligase